MSRITGSEGLYRLIHSLTAEEKGYFKKFAKRHISKGNSYLQLFDTINKQSNFNETALKKKYKNLSVLKNYLFELILQSLVISEAAPTTSQTILKGIIQIQLLIKKGLTANALKMLRVYKAMAEDSELYFLLSHLLKIEVNLLRPSWKVEEMLERIEEVHKSRKLAEDKQRVLDDLLIQGYLGYALTELENHTGVKSNPEEWMDIDFLLVEKNSFSIESEVKRLSALNYYYILKEDIPSYHENTGKIYAIRMKKWQETKGKSSMDDYVKAINNYVVSSIEMKDLQLADKLTESLLAIDFKDETLILENRIRYTHLKQTILWNAGNHKEGEGFSNEMLEKYQLMKQFPFLQLKLLAIMGAKILFEFSNLHYKEVTLSLNFFNPSVLESYSAEDKKSAEFLNLMVQFETGDHELIGTLSKSISTRIKTLTPQERAFLFAFTKYHHSLKELFEYLEKNCGEMVVHQLLFIKDWIESKTSKKPLAEIVRKNHSSRN